MNSEKALIRKQQSILVSSGLAMILFGIWSIIRMIMLRFIDSNHFLEYIQVEQVDVGAEYYNYILIIVLAVLLFDLLIRLYIGTSAIREGFGKYKKRITYIIFAIIIFTVSVGADIVSLIPVFNGDIDLEFVFGILIDISLHIATFEIIVAAIRVRKLTKISGSK